MGRVNEAEGSDVGPPVLEVFQVDQVEVEAGDQVVVVGGHHTHGLSAEYFLVANQYLLVQACKPRSYACSKL